MFKLDYKFTADAPWQTEGEYPSFEKAFQASRDLLEDGYIVQIEEV